MQHLIERPEQTDDDYAVAYGGKDYVLFYMPYGHSITVNLSGWTQRKNVRLEWFNPRNGELIFYKISRQVRLLKSYRQHKDEEMTGF